MTEQQIGSERRVKAGSWGGARQSDVERSLPLSAAANELEAAARAEAGTHARRIADLELMLRAFLAGRLAEYDLAPFAAWPESGDPFPLQAGADGLPLLTDDARAALKDTA